MLCPTEEPRSFWRNFVLTTNPPEGHRFTEISPARVLTAAQTIAPSIAVPGVPRGEAEALVAKAHQGRPCSNATHYNIDVKLTVDQGSPPEAPLALRSQGGGPRLPRASACIRGRKI
jgi:hypothetical protein